MRAVSICFDTRVITEPEPTGPGGGISGGGRSASPRRSWGPDILGIAWVLAAAGAVLAPALAHGAFLGPYDVLSRYGLSSQPGVVVHYTGPSDQIQQMIPWTTLAWTEVHGGHLPLWNPYSATGMPLAFNWLSAAFSVPAAVGYLFPLHLAYTAAIVTTLVIAGTGVYVLCRLIGLGTLGCVMAATVFELSGPLVGWLGWPLSGVMAWAGWLFAAAILVIRGRRRARAVALLAVILAFVLYAGQPETAVELGIALVVFVIVLLALRAPWLGGSGPVLRPAVGVVAGGLAGVALAAPLLLPGLQVTAASIRRAVGYYAALPPHDLVHVVFQGFDGIPVAGSRWFGPSIYPESAAYVGVIALVLAVTAVAVRRRPEVLAFGAVVLTMAALVFLSPVVTILHSVTHERGVAWQRSLLPMAFALAVLAGVGLDTIVRAHDERAVRAWAGGGFVVAALVVGVLWAFGRGHLPAAEAGIRRDSFIWPATDIVVGVAVVAALVLADKRRRRNANRAGPSRLRVGHVAGAVMLACETVFLVIAGAPLLSSSPASLAPTPAEAVLQRAVGSALVGLGARACSQPPTLGILPNVNVAFDVHELAVYDPVIPAAFFRTWRATTGEPGGPALAPLVFCPAITSVTVARRYGVGYILEPTGRRGPPGTVLATQIGSEGLWRVPGAAQATLSPLSADGGFPADDAPGSAVAVTHPGPAKWDVVTNASSPRVLRLRLSDIPGWHASVDGRPLALDSFAGVMLEVRVPAGRHRIELHYWPDNFSTGLVVAAAVLVMLLVAVVASRARPPRHAAS